MLLNETREDNNANLINEGYGEGGANTTINRENITSLTNTTDNYINRP
jgi:hypothetical protein